MTAQRSLIPALVFAAGLACTATAQAQPYGNAWGYSQDHQRSAFNNGYRSGFDRGRDDARGRRYDYGRHDAYKNADWGYDRDDGSRGAYRDAFRQGFIAGYDDGYYGRGGRGYVRSYPDNDRDYRYQNDRPYVAAPPVYQNVPVYPQNGYPQSGGYPQYGGGYVNGNPGFDRGYRDGLDKGRNDGKHHDSYDPRRQSWYRDADRGYKDHYGPKYSYESAYRDGFLRGYDEGYRDRGRW